MYRNHVLITLALSTLPAFGQTPPMVKLTLAEATAMALKNHPQIQAAQNAASAVGQQVIEARAPYYPIVAGDLTGSGANQEARIGAGALSTSRLFNRYGNGISVAQLVTDWGRTPNLVAAARFRADAAQQTYQATRFDVMLRVNQSYFNVLRAAATIRVAQQTVAARQLVVDQVTALANNNLRSQLDVTFVDVSLSQARLLRIQAQDAQQEAFAELTRALGTQQAAVYNLAEEPLPASPPPDPEPLIVQALGTRPELQGLRLEREGAHRFEQAERDLKYPNVNLVGVGGYIPWIEQITLPRVIPNEYAGAAVDVHIPVFNGHLFTARREEAHYRALEADQRVRDVRTAWAIASTAYQRLDVTAQMLRGSVAKFTRTGSRGSSGSSDQQEVRQRGRITLIRRRRVLCGPLSPPTSLALSESSPSFRSLATSAKPSLSSHIPSPATSASSPLDGLVRRCY